MSRDLETALSVSSSGPPRSMQPGFVPSPSFSDPRVVFSATEPTAAPWNLLPVADDTETGSHRGRQHHRGRLQRRRTRRSFGDDVDSMPLPPPSLTSPWIRGGDRRLAVDADFEDGQRGRGAASVDAGSYSSSTALKPVCQSVSRWVRRTEADDFLGNRVRLVQDLDNGSSRVGQYFYETLCVTSSSTAAASSQQHGQHHHRRHNHEQQMSPHHHQQGCNGIDSDRLDHSVVSSFIFINIF